MVTNIMVSIVVRLFSIPGNGITSDQKSSLWSNFGWSSEASLGIWTLISIGIGKPLKVFTRNDEIKVENWKIYSDTSAGTRFIAVIKCKRSERLDRGGGIRHCWSHLSFCTFPFHRNKTPNFYQQTWPSQTKTMYPSFLCSSVWLCACVSCSVTTHILVFHRFFCRAS